MAQEQKGDSGRQPRITAIGSDMSPYSSDLSNDLDTHLDGHHVGEPVASFVMSSPGKIPRHLEAVPCALKHAKDETNRSNIGVLLHSRAPSVLRLLHHLSTHAQV